MAFRKTGCGCGGDPAGRRRIGRLPSHAREQEIDEHALTELDLYIRHSSEPLYRQKLKLAKVLSRFVSRGTFDPKKAVFLYEYLVESAARLYAREYASPEEWSKLFPPALRRKLSEQLAQEEYGKLMRGEYAPEIPTPRMVNDPARRSSRHDPGIVRDDREDKRAPRKGYVVATDTFLSGWGQAEGKSYYALAVDTEDEAYTVMANLKDRREMKRVRFVSRLPRLGHRDHMTIADKTIAPRYFEKGHPFRESHDPRPSSIRETWLEGKKILSKVKRIEIQSEDSRSPKLLVVAEDPARRCPVGTEVQTLVLSKASFDLASARAWVEKHGFLSPKTDETGTSYRFRQKHPRLFRPKSFRTIELTEGVKAVIGCPR